MSTTGAIVITQVRDLIHDKVATYRWSDAQMWQHIQTESINIIKKHPEAGYIDTVSIPTVGLMVASTEDIALIDQFVPQLVSAIVARILEEDATQARQLPLAQVHKKQSEEV